MTIKIKSPATVPEGTYQATFEGLESKTSQKDGNPYYRWEFEVLTVEGAKTVSGMSSQNTGPKSKSHKWLSALLGRRPLPDEELDEVSLFGSACMVVLEENSEGYSNVADVLPAPRLSEKTIAQYAAEADAAPGDSDDLPWS